MHSQDLCVCVCASTATYTHICTNVHSSIAAMSRAHDHARCRDLLKCCFHSMRRVLLTESSSASHDVHFISFLVFTANMHCRILRFDVYIIISTRGSDDHPPHFTSSCGYHGNQLLQSIKSKNEKKDILIINELVISGIILYYTNLHCHTCNCSITAHWLNQVCMRRYMKLNNLSACLPTSSLTHASPLCLSSWLMWHQGRQACHISSRSSWVTQWALRAQKWSGPRPRVGLSFFFFLLFCSPEHRQTQNLNGGNERSHDIFMWRFPLFINCQSLPNYTQYIGSHRSSFIWAL